MASIPAESTLLLNLDSIQDELVSPFTASDELCCCQIIDPNLQASQHLDDCELRLLGLHESLASSNSSEEDQHALAKRRKHRESMARLRRGWRTSIAALQDQYTQLQDELKRTVATPSPQEKGVQATPLTELQRGYRSLVEEQLRLQDEMAGLEASRAQSEKYARLLERELARVQLFHLPTE